MSLFVVDQSAKAPRRLVYRLLPNEVEAVAVGRRRLMDVYVQAARRLGRLVDDEQ